MGDTVSRRKFLGAAMASVVTADAAVNAERQPMPKSMMEDLSRRMAAANKAALDHRFSRHCDA